MALEVIGIGIAVALARAPKRRVTAALLTLTGSAAGTMLTAHGALFISFGLVAAWGGQPVSSELRWYALLWGPWFLLGGVLFLLAVRSYAAADKRDWLTRSARTAGVLGGFATAAAPFVVSALAG